MTISPTTRRQALIFYTKPLLAGLIELFFNGGLILAILRLPDLRQDEPIICYIELFIVRAFSHEDWPFSEAPFA